MSSTTFIRPSVLLPSRGEPLTTSWTLPDIVDFNAENNPNYIFAHQTRKYGADTKTLVITHQNLQNAVSRCQSWVLSNVPHVRQHSDNRQPIALFMESDVGLWIHMLALLGLDVPVLLLSARLGPAPVKHLLEKTNAKAILASPRLWSVMKEGLDLLEQEYSILTVERQTCEFFLDTNNSVNERRSVSFVDRSRKPTTDAVILHSSGTTGLPKPIYHPHQYLLGFAAAHLYHDHDDVPKLNCSTLPLYHGFGLVAPCLSMSIGMTMCLPVSNVASASTILQLIRNAHAESLMTVPSILEDIVNSPEETWVEIMSKLSFVAFGGGPLKEAVGQRLSAKGTQLLNHYGATEVGALAPIFSPKPGSGYDYHYFRLREDFNLEIRSVENKDLDRPAFKLTAHPFGWDTVFEVQDNLVSNPAHPHTDFNAVGRNDDWIVLSTGEKVLPNLMENFITELESVKVAIVFGQNQFQVGLLVQPSRDVPLSEQEAFIDSIWPTVERSNQMVDAHARISSKQAILVVSSDKPIARTDKGSISRKEVNAAFEQEFAQVYLGLESDDGASIPPLDLQDLEQELKNLVQSSLAWKVPSNEWNADDDLFDLGMDSLQALQLRRLIISGVAHCDFENTPRDFVYQYPSLRTLSAAIRGGGHGPSTDPIEHFCQQYVPKASPFEVLTPPSKGFVVVLTGSTGSLGAHILVQLANTASVERVICLNRVRVGVSPLEQQISALQSKNLTLSDSAWSKVEAFQTDTSKPHLGLPEKAFSELEKTTTHIIHNAWPMDFNRRVTSFEAQFRTVSNLLELARTVCSERPFERPTILFVSSIAVVGQYPKLTGERIVPEIPMGDNQSADDFGYAKAKLVCERMMEGAAKVWGQDLNAKYVRVGQMTGAEETGLWNATEHFPALVKSSKLIGALPELKGTLSWLPVDHAATATIDILFDTSSRTVFHLENPIRQSWHDVLKVIASEIGLESPAFVPYRTWLETVLAVPDEKLDANPAKKLASFFQGDFEHMSGGEIVMDTAESRRASESLRRQQAIHDELVKRYVDGWRKVGFLQ